MGRKRKSRIAGRILKCLYDSDPVEELDELLSCREAYIMGKSRITPAYIAVEKNNRDALRILIERGTFINIRPKYPSRRTPLHVAADKICPDLEIIQMLLNEGSDINARDAKGRTPLEIALRIYKRYVDLAPVDFHKFGFNYDDPDDVRIIQDRASSFRACIDVLRKSLIMHNFVILMAGHYQNKGCLLARIPPELLQMVASWSSY